MILGKPIRACASHVIPMRCGCLGVELGEVEELNAATHPGCAFCRMQPRRTRPTFRTLRKCSRHGCYGRFHTSAYDDSFIPERLALLSRLLHIFHVEGIKK